MGGIFPPPPVRQCHGAQQPPATRLLSYGPARRRRRRLLLCRPPACLARLPACVGRRRTGGSFRRIVSAPPFLFVSYPLETKAFSFPFPLPAAGPGRFEPLRGSRFGRPCAAAAAATHAWAHGEALSRLRLRAGAVLGSRSVRWSMSSPLGAQAPPRVIPSTASSLRMLVITAAPGGGEGDFSAFTLVQEDHLGLWSPCWKRRSWAATRVENTCRCGDVQRGSREGKRERPGPDAY